MRGLGSIPTRGNILSLEFSCFHAVKTKCQHWHFCAYVKNPSGSETFQ